MNTLVHGCYDRATLATLRELGLTQFGFDLRATSPNLVPFAELRALIATLRPERLILTFQNDRESTVLSFLDLLKAEAPQLLPEFRDRRDVSFYHSLHTPFLWMFHPDGDWRNILMLPNCKGVLLPLAWRSHYEREPWLWSLIEERGLEVYLHADTFAEATTLSELKDVSLSLDLTNEVESSYRRVDQERLKQMQLWRKLNEAPSL